MKLHAVIIASLLASPSAFAADGAMKAGKWQMTMYTEEDGKQTGKMTMTQCMTAEQIGMQIGAAGTPEAMEMEGESDGCKYSHKQNGNTMDMMSTCGAEVTRTTITTTAESYSMRASVTGGEENSTTVMEGKRVGDCG